MKKLLALLLALVLTLSLAACAGGNDLEAAAREIERITGEKTTAEDVKAAMEDLEALSGEKVTAQDVVDFTREMYELLDGDDSNDGDDEPDAEAWPLADIPQWPVAEGLSWNNYYGDDQTDIYVTGGPEEMETWLAELREVGFNGYFWGGKTLYYINENYQVSLDDRGAAEGQYHLVIRSGEMELGLPAELQGLFPDYNGDGAVIYGGSEEYDGVTRYFFTVAGETEEGGQRYLQTLIDDGFVSENDGYYSDAAGYYYKTVDGQQLGYESEEYWYDFDTETGTGEAGFCLSVGPG